MTDETSPAVPTPLASAVEKLEALLKTDEGKAIETAIAQRLAARINGLPGAGGGTPGVKTSEFWCLVVFSLLSLSTMLAGALPPKWALACQAVSVGLYQISRGLTKHGTGN